MRTKIANTCLFLIFCIYLFIGCSASSKFTKKAQKLENAGLIEEAADSYYQALRSDNDNIDAKIGLKRTAPKILEKKMTTYRTLSNSQNYFESYNKFTEAVNYQQKVRRVGILIDISTSDKNLFDRNKKKLADIHYSKGTAYLNSKLWSNAINEFEKVMRYVSNYKNTSSLIIQAKNSKDSESAEQSYQRGLSFFNSNQYRSAYSAFKECLKYRSNYKEAVEFRRKSLEKGKVRIGIFPFKNDTRLYNVEKTLYAYVVSNSVNYSSPFIE